MNTTEVAIFFQDQLLEKVSAALNRLLNTTEISAVEGEVNTFTAIALINGVALRIWYSSVKYVMQEIVTNFPMLQIHRRFSCRYRVDLSYSTKLSK